MALHDPTPTRASRWLRTPAHLRGDDADWRNVFRFAVYNPWHDEVGCYNVGGTFLEYHRDYGDGPEYQDNVAEVDDMAEALHVLSQCDPQDFI